MKKINVVFITATAVLSLTTAAFAENGYSPEEKKFLLGLARQTLETYLKDGRMPSVKEGELTERLKEKRPCFVTLEKKGSLRGCMGMFEFTSPLYKNTMDRAAASATGDPRFFPVSYGELKDITIEISVLTEPKPLSFDSPEDLLAKLNPFEDGVILHTRYGSSTYLPQVWESLPDKEDFLSSLCQKHGAPADYWRDNYKNMRIEIYKAVHFKEGESG
jgi:AmmeMemoRadiSam system protein A